MGFIFIIGMVDSVLYILYKSYTKIPYKELGTSCNS